MKGNRYGIKKIDGTSVIDVFNYISCIHEYQHNKYNTYIQGY